jgi:hypothetical protein
MKKDKKRRLCAAGMAWLLLLGGALLLSGCDEIPELEEPPADGGTGGDEPGGDGGALDAVQASVFSNTTGAANSAIDLIKAAKDAGKTSVTVNLPAGAGTEVVRFADETDFGTSGLVLDSTTSPTSVTIDGGGRTVDLQGAPSNSPLITVGDGVILTLKNITFKGLKLGETGDTANNTRAVIKVADGGKLILTTGAVIRDNYSTGGAGDGGGGILVFGKGELVMNGGTIKDNTATGPDSAGGVYVYFSTFTMTGGEISGNKNTNLNLGGGGVQVHGITEEGDIATFNMSGSAVIKNNEAATSGGGVFIRYGAEFNMSGGEISGNKANGGGGYGYGYGGGVIVSGGGVLPSKFTMSGGFIKGNTANVGGGGVGISNAVTFSKTGGTIYGNDTNDASLRNTATNDNGHAVRVYFGEKKRNTTAGTTDMMSHDVSGQTDTGWDN